MTFSKEQKKSLIAEKMREILIILGLDISDPSLADTPHRIAKMYVDEIFSGLEAANFPKMTFQEENIPHELVLIKTISFVSFCEHHFVPIVGKAHIAYYPKKRLLGLSKIPRIVRFFAARPQLQERLTGQISESLVSILETNDVAVSLRGFHFCVLARGVEDLTAEMETHVLKGCFEKDCSARSEFFIRISETASYMPCSHSRAAKGT
jgi:GTP cyclohydrolase IA